MSASGLLIELNGVQVWAFVVEHDSGYRIRLALDDWQRLNVGIGQRLPVRLPGAGAVRLFVTAATEQPPVVWVTVATRMRAAG